jgi:hypothetical protein
MQFESDDEIKAVILTGAGERASMRFLESRILHVLAEGRALTPQRAHRGQHPQLAHPAGLLPGRGGIPSLVRERRRASPPSSSRVATWIEAATRELAAPSVKQRLAAIRHLFDWLVTGQVVPVNPAGSVRGPRHVVTSGQTPVLDPSEARALLDSIDTSTPAGLRDRALVSLKGIGRWSAEIYLIFALGRPDVWPAGDLGLQLAVAECLGLDARPGEAALRAIGEAWQPWRSVSACLFWQSYYTRAAARPSAGAGDLCLGGLGFRQFESLARIDPVGIADLVAIGGVDGGEAQAFAIELAGDHP